MTYVSLIGRKDIHVSLIRRSYRMRGIVVRVAINMDITVRDCVIMSEVDRMGDNDFCNSRMVDIRDTKMMFKYSAIKIKANVNLEYSVLNPDTSSLSPSAKSKGVRFVSARRQMNQT